MSPDMFVVRNNMPVAGWTFMAIWTAMLVAFTWMFVREGGFNQFEAPVEIAIMVLFWLFGIVGCFYFFEIPRVEVTVANGEVTVAERWLWRRRIERFAAESIAQPVLSQEKDSEGDPYYVCRLGTPTGRTVTVAEHHHRPTVEAVRDRLRAALG